MRGNVFKKLAAAVVSLSMLGSAAVMPVSATDYADQAVDISKFDKGCTYTADTDTAAITIGTGGKQAWSKLDLTPYTTKKGDHISSVKVSYTETVPSGGRSQIGFFDNDLADWANNAYQSTVGSAVCYGVLGRDVEKRFYYYDGGKETKLAGKFAVDSSENVEITFDLDNEKMSGNVGAQTFTDLPINIDSIDTMAIYSWSEMTYTLSNLKITTVVSDENYYTVTYSVNGTETTESVVKNGNVKKIPDTDLSGYTFKGWSTDGTTVYDETETYMTTEEVQAAAVTAPVTYTAVYEQDTSYIEPIVSAVVSGASSMTFGADPNTAAENPYRVTITGEKGTVIDADTIDSRVTDFNVEWDIDGFKTENDTEGQYCDSYGSFSVNNSASASTVFNLRNVPMNFYGKLTATITYNGSTIEATPIYVVALGNTTQGTHDVLPSGGYPSDFSKYPSSLVGYTAAVSGDNKTGTDIITDNFVVVGSDSGKGATLKEENGVKYFNITKNTAKKSAMFAHPLSLNAVQTIYKQRLRFNSDGATITFTTGYPIWNDKNKYAATFSYTGGQASLNDMLLLSGENAAAVTTSTWYDLVISLDSTCSKAWAKLYKTDGTLVGEISNVAFTDAGTNPTFYAVGMGNSNTGSVDFAGYSVYYPAADNTKFELNASQTTLSIPNGDSATLSASLKSTEGYDMTAEAEWSILEDDMKTGITITPSEDDSHTATVTLDNTASAGTATVQVNIGGYVKTIALNITSSAESIKFINSSTSVSIPLDASAASTATYSAVVINGDGEEQTGREITLAAYDKTNTTPYTFGNGISFDASTGTLSVTSDAAPATFVIRATGQNSNGEAISRAVTVTVHGLAFDFGSGEDETLADGYTEVTPSTTYNTTRGYGIEGTATAGGTGSAEDAKADYLEGSYTFKANVLKGKIYTVEITYSGTLTSAYVNADLAGYKLGTHTALTTAIYTVAAPTDILDLTVTNGSIAAITITKNADRTPLAKPAIHHVGDSTAANNGSWAYYIDHNRASFPALEELATFYNNGAGGRNLCSYYTEGKLASVLASIYPGDIVMFGNNGTNGMGSSFEEDVNYYLDAAEAMGAKIIINSYTPHGAVGSYANCYNSETGTFNAYRQDSYDVIVRAVAEERAEKDENYLGFVEIGKNADAAFNAYVADYEKNGYASKDAAAQAIISCFSDHNHYSEGSIARELMLNGYGETEGIVSQLVNILKNNTPEEKKVSVTEKKLEGTTLTATIENTTDSDVTIGAIVAVYDANGVLVGIHTETKTISADAVNVSSTLDTTGLSYSSVKGFIWNMANQNGITSALSAE